MYGQWVPNPRFEKAHRQHYELTLGGRLGPGPTDDTEGTILNRVIW